MKLYITQALMLVMIIASVFCGSDLVVENTGYELSVKFMLPTEDTSQGLRIELEFVKGSSNWSKGDALAAVFAPHDDGTTITGTENKGFIFWWI